MIQFPCTDFEMELRQADAPVYAHHSIHTPISLKLKISFAQQRFFRPECLVVRVIPVVYKIFKEYRLIIHNT